MINFRAFFFFYFFFAILLLATSVPANARYGAVGALSSPSPTPSPSPSPSPPHPDVSDIITESVFNQLIPNRNFISCPAHDFYTYEAFVTAAIRFPEFGNFGDNENRTRELAAFFAQTSTKTTGGTVGAPDEYEWGYCYKEHPSAIQCVPGDWRCAPNQSYHPRGPIGLQFKYNYRRAGEALGYDLINNPGLVSQDPVVSFETAIWYWMTSRTAPVPSCHSVMVGTWIPTEEDKKAGRLQGYGATINILFPYECEQEQESYHVLNSINFYNRSTSILEVSPGENVHCRNQQPFPATNPNNLGNVLKMPIYKA